MRLALARFLSREFAPDPLIDTIEARRTLFIVALLVVTGFGAGLLFEDLSGQADAFDALAFPLCALGIGVVGVLPLFSAVLVRPVALAIVTFAALFFTAKFVFVLFLAPASVSVPRELVETFFWLPNLYALSLFLPAMRSARLVAGATFALIFVFSLVKISLNALGNANHDVTYALIQLNLSHLALLALTGFLLDVRGRLAALRTRAETMERLAKTDLLTGLPNRMLFLSALDDAVRRPREPGRVGALLFIDLDNFKAINDTCGHAAGDEVLRGVAERLSAHIAHGDVLARMSGDEFVLLAPDISPPRALDLARTLCDALAAPFEIAGRRPFVTASIGVTFFSGGEEPAKLLRRADDAMYSVKRAGKNGVRLAEFEPA